MSDADLITRILSGRYVLERLIGRGGMASVYLARDLKQGRRVAVKVLDPEFAGTLTSERFLREISIAAKLAHPNVLPLHDSGEDAGRLYYVMPFVEGETLRDRLDREGPLALDEALRVAHELVDALDYAHGQQVLHRDIKPENVLLEQGHAVIADFGIARALDAGARERLTSTGISLGTPAYMSPEQATGETRLDARSDVYSLACVIYEMLAGEPPFTGASAQSIIAKRLAGPPPNLHTVRPSVPRHVVRALLCAMDRNPADRFASAGAFGRALAGARGAGQPGVRRFLATRRVQLAAALLVALAAGVVWAITARPSSSASPLPTVAVLPLLNESSDAEHAYLAEGLTDALIQDLGRSHGLRVVSRASVMQATGAMMPMPATGSATARTAMPGGMSFMESREGGGAAASRSAPAAPMKRMPSLGELSTALRADVMMQGSFARAGDSVRVDATLVRTPSLQQIWRHSFTRHVRDLFALQRDLAVAVAHGVESSDGEPTVVQAGAVRAYAPDAHEAYLKGAYFQAHWKLSQAVTAFERAVELDPSHAPAQAGLSRAYYFLSFFGKVPPSVAVAAMRRAATAALERDSTLAEAHGQMALVQMLQDWNWEGAERHFRRALELSPGQAQIRHDYAHFLLGQGRQRESAQQTRQALALDPVNPMLISCLGWHNLFDGRYAEARAHAVEANVMMPDHWAYVVEGWALLGEGQRDSALAAMRAARRLDDSAFTLAALGHVLAVAGRTAEARATLDSLLALGEREYVSPYDVATIYAGLGERDESFRWLRRAADERSTFIVHVGWDARFDALRSDARFIALAERQLRLPTPRFAALTAEARRGF